MRFNVKHQQYHEPNPTAAVAFAGPNGAGKSTLRLTIAILSKRRRSFGFETVLSDPEGEKIRFLRLARDAGYFVAVHFVGLDSPELSRARVTDRVQKGGHDERGRILWSADLARGG